MSLALRLSRGLLRWTLRPVLARTRSVRVLRSVASAAALAIPPVRGVDRQRWNGAGLEFRPRDARDRPVLIWFHGGGYVAGSPRSHRGMLAQLARAARLRILAPAYPLAPEHPGTAARDFGLRLCQGLLAGGLAPQDLILGGDSAGGGLAAAVAAGLCAEGTPPGGLVLLSPWTDMTGSGGSHRANAGRDDVLPSGRLDHLVQLVRGDLPPDDPRLSPLMATYPGLPRAYLSVGAEEILRDDTERLAARLVEGGTRVTARVVPGAPHVLALLAPIVPEARAELRRIAAWIDAGIAG